METESKKKYPYLPEDRVILYVPKDNKYMVIAKETALKESTDKKFSTGAVIVHENGEVLVKAANQSSLKNDFLIKTHPKWCLRKLFKVPSGKNYWLCPGCASPKYHAEYYAVQKAKKEDINISGADLYLWGHWWCCQSCWNAMIGAGVRNVYLEE